MHSLPQTGSRIRCQDTTPTDTQSLWRQSTTIYTPIISTSFLSYVEHALPSSYTSKYTIRTISCYVLWVFYFSFLPPFPNVLLMHLLWRENFSKAVKNVSVHKSFLLSLFPFCLPRLNSFFCPFKSLFLLHTLFLPIYFLRKKSRISSPTPSLL